MASPVEHLKALIGEALDVVQMLHGGLLLALRLARVDVEQMPEVADAVVPVLVQRPQQLLQALLDAVRVGRVLVERVRVARHGVALLLVDGGEDALLVDGRQLALLHHLLVLHRLGQFLESASSKRPFV